MGRKDKQYSRTLKEQIYDRLTSMLHAGEGQSKKVLKATDSIDDKIFSYNTYHTYKKHCDYFADYIKQNHPECTTLKASKKYVVEWLQHRTASINIRGEPLSAWTIQTERQALSKLYGIKPDDPQFFTAPRRRRVDIKRSRGSVANDKHFSERNNSELVEFCKGTGCRRNILTRLTGKDLYTRVELIEELNTTKDVKRQSQINDALSLFPDKEYFLYHSKDKGGKCRFAPIIGEHTDEIVARMQATAPNERVWLHISKHADVHGYRGDYASALYKDYARPIKDIPYDRYHSGLKLFYQSEVYVCRKDEAGKKLDRLAMQKCTKALGHNRLDVIANNYIRGL